MSGHNLVTLNVTFGDLAQFFILASFVIFCNFSTSKVVLSFSPLCLVVDVINFFWRKCKFLQNLKMVCSIAWTCTKNTKNNYILCKSML